jgi:hypothetical protein
MCHGEWRHVVATRSEEAFHLADELLGPADRTIELVRQDDPHGRADRSVAG